MLTDIKKSKYNAFIGTIAVCVVYAIIAILLLLFCNFTDIGKELSIDYKPFLITFVIGTILIIICSTIMVINWIPTPEDPNLNINKPNSAYSCPEYYNMTTDPPNKFTKQAIINNSSNLQQVKTIKGSNDEIVSISSYLINTENIKLLNNYCQYDDNILDAGVIFTKNTHDNKVTPQELGLFGIINSNVMKIDDTTTNAIKTNDIIAGSMLENDNNEYSYNGYDCTRVYPEYLNMLDLDYNKTHPNVKNKHRCAWADKCGIPWTEAGCD